MTEHREKFDANHALSHKFNKDEASLLKSVLAGDKHTALVKDAQEQHSHDRNDRAERTALGVQNRELDELRKNFQNLLPEGTVIAGHAKSGNHDCLLVKPNKDSNDVYAIDPETNTARGHYKIEHQGGKSTWVQVAESQPLSQDHGELKKGDVVSSYSDKGQVATAADGHVREIKYPPGSKNIRSLQFDEHGQPQKWTDGDGGVWTRQGTPHNGEATWVSGNSTWKGKVTFNSKDNSVTEQADGSDVQKTFNRNGSEIEKRKDGGTITRSADGHGNVEFPKGCKNIHGASFDAQGHVSELTDGRGVKWTRQTNPDANGESVYAASDGQKFNGVISFNKSDESISLQAHGDPCKKTFNLNGSESNAYGDGGVVSIAANGQIREIAYPNSKNITDVKFDAHGKPNEWVDGEKVKWTRHGEPDGHGNASWIAAGKPEWKGVVAFNSQDNSLVAVETATNIQTTCAIDGTKVVINRNTNQTIRFNKDGSVDSPNSVIAAGAIDDVPRHHAGYKIDLE
ncbi:MAG TPA: hypothetical protein V6C97_11320 [Oculatellaceae cyanobacterium]